MLERLVGGAGEGVAEGLELVEAAADGLLGAEGGELGERGLQREVDLQGGLAGAVLIEVEPAAEGELLAGQHGVAAAEQGGEALLRAQRVGALAAAAGRLVVGQGDVAGRRPGAVGDLDALAVADAQGQGLLGDDLAQDGVGGGGAEGAQRRR